MSLFQFIASVRRLIAKPSFMACCLQLFLMAPGEVLAATPSDISVLKSLTGPELKGRTNSEIEKQLVALAFARTDALAQSRGYPASLRTRNNALVRSVITKEINGSVGTNSLASPTARKRILNLALSVMSGHLSERALAFAAHQPAPRPPETKQQARPLSHSARVASQGPLMLDLSRSSVKTDKGTVGAHNGILDPGEIATLDLFFVNKSPERLVSTSLYVKSLSNCLFTTDVLGKEIQLSEMVGSEISPTTGLPVRKGASNVKLNIYASSECAGKTGTIVMDAYDTHRFASTPIRYVLTLSLSGAAEARLVNVRVDRDEYGHSEPQKGRIIQPGERVEVSAGLALRRPGYSFAYQTFLPPLGAAKHSHDPGLMSFRSLNGRYVAAMHDDLDLSFHSKQSLLQALEPIAEAYAWRSPQDARVYVGVDTTFGKQSQRSSEHTGETTYTFNAGEFKRALSGHLHVEVDQRAASSASKGRIAVGQVEGFRVELDDPGPLLAKLQSIDLTVNRAETTKDSAYSVRHYIELPIFWERILNPSCVVSAPKTVRVGLSFSVGVRYKDVPVGSTIKVNGNGLRYAEQASETEGFLNVGRVKMVSRKTEISVQVVDQDGSTICVNRQRIIDTTPTTTPKKKRFVKRSKPELPITTIVANGHIAGLGGYDLSATLGRKVGVVSSVGRLDYGKTMMVGAKATQLLYQGPVFQLNLNESIEFGKGWIERVGGPYSHTRAAFFLSVHKWAGLNVGMHFETDRFGGLAPSMRLGVGGFFGAKYD
jgi:hypothetical protein